MRTEWRDGGPPPKISFQELCWLTDTPWMSKNVALTMWMALIETAQAEGTYSTREGVLPAYYSFVEELCVLYDVAARHDMRIPWSELVPAAMISATPCNWEMIPCARMVL